MQPISNINSRALNPLAPLDKKEPEDVKRAGAAFRLPQNIAPHSFRKVYAVDLMRKYGDIERVKRALNHGSQTTTMIYAMADGLLTAKQLSRAARYGVRL